MIQMLLRGTQTTVNDSDLKTHGNPRREFVTQNYSRARLLDDIRTLYRELPNIARVSPK